MGRRPFMIVLERDGVVVGKASVPAEGLPAAEILRLITDVGETGTVIRVEQVA